MAPCASMTRVSRTYSPAGMGETSMDTDPVLEALATWRSSSHSSTDLTANDASTSTAAWPDHGLGGTCTLQSDLTGLARPAKRVYSAIRGARSVVGDAACWARSSTARGVSTLAA